MIFFVSAITIICCLGITLTFRQTDKNSKYIEKLRKYSNKISDDLDSFVKEKTSNLSEVAIELNSKQTVAIAAIKKLDTLQDEFVRKTKMIESRMHTIEGIERQLNNSEQTMQKLLNMTLLAEKNLEQISRETDFVDSLAKQVGAAKDELDMVASAIPEMQNFFSNESRSQLEQYKQKIMEEMSAGIEGIENRLAAVKKSSEDLFEVSAIKLQDLYKKCFEEASAKAAALEDSAFKTLKEEASKRVREYKVAFEQAIAALEEDLSGKISETSKHMEEFKQELFGEAEYFSEKIKREFAETEEEINGKSQLLIQKMNEAETALSQTSESLKTEFESGETALRTQLNSMLNSFQSNIENLTKHSDKRLAEFKTQAELRFNKFEELISGTDLIQAEVEKTKEAMYKKLMQELEQYTAAFKQKQDEITQSFNEETGKLVTRLKTIEASIGGLKAKAYSKVSEKLQSFEAGFFEDLSKRSSEINANFEKQKADVAEKLALLASDSESARKDVEDAYTNELKTRLAQVAEDYKGRVVGLDKKIAEIENHLSQRIDSADNSFSAQLESVKEKLSAELEQSSKNFEKELSDYKIQLKDSVTSHHFEAEKAAKELQDWVESVKETSSGEFAKVKKEFEIWRTGTEQKFNAARSLFDDKVNNIDTLISQGIDNLDKKYSAQYETFSSKNADLFVELENKTEELNEKAASMKENFFKDIEAASENISRMVENANSVIDEKMREYAAETDSSLMNTREMLENMNSQAEDTLGNIEKLIENAKAAINEKIRESEASTNESLVSTRDMIQNLRTDIGNIREKTAVQIQEDSNRLNAVLEEIERKQEEFIAQTNVFNKADEMKKDLAQSIEKLHGEVSKFEIYRKTIEDLGFQYDKVCHMEEQAKQKISDFMGEKKRVDLLESQFAALSSLMDTVEKRRIELEAANDKFQGYQVQIRKVEENVKNMNTRYERIEQKESVLKQTAADIDKAFDSLKTLETDLGSFKEYFSSLPSEIENIKASMEVLLADKDKADTACGKIEEIDSMITEMNENIEKLQGARSWLAATETRLQELSNEVDAKLKLLSALYKSEPSEEGKENGAPALSTRESVIALYRQGWKAEEIANSLKISRGEVDLIIEYSDKI